MGEQTELMLIAKARFGKAAEMRPRLLALVQRGVGKREYLLIESNLISISTIETSQTNQPPQGCRKLGEANI